MDLRHVARLSKARRDLAEQLAKSDSRGDIELAESLRPTLKHALESLKHLYNDKDVWQAAAQAGAAVDVPTRQLIELVANYQESLPALLELFGYLEPPPAAQLVSNAVTSLQAVPADEGPTAAINAINETRQALGQLLDKTLNLEDAQPWLLPDIASETIPALDMGVTLAAGALTGGVMTAIGAAVLPAAVASGGLAVAPMMILGGIYWWRRKRHMRTRNEKLLELQEQIPLDLVPAARAAVLQHLDAIVSLDQRTIDENPQALLDLSDHLQALIDITRRFGVSDSHLRTEAKQEMIKGNDAFASDVLVQLPKVFAAALKAKGSLDAGGQIGQETCAELKKQREVFKNLGPRFGKKPPSLKPTP
jgi:hypothetical protein